MTYRCDPELFKPFLTRDFVDPPMTFQEIHERICVNRSNLISTSEGAVIINVNEVLRKVNEIEWALQSLAEKLAQKETT
jgi:hypothetical protein